MKPDPKAIAEAARRIGVTSEELDRVLSTGSAVIYQGGDYLFHESAPRQWLGIVMDGEVELLRGQRGQTFRVGLAQSGAMLSEGVMLDDLWAGLFAGIVSMGLAGVYHGVVEPWLG